MALKIHIKMDWEIGGATLDLALIAQLLEGISETGTVRAAANNLGISYRTVWGKLEAAEVALGQKLVLKNKGHGSVVTKVGENLKSLVLNLTSNLHGVAKLEQEGFERDFRRLFTSEPRKLKLACSHDIIFEECMQAELLPAWDIRFMGSQKAIDALRGGAVDLAGFHLSDKMAGQPGMKELWADPRYFVKPIMRRELGLVVAKGNSLGIRCIDDLIRPDVRFINRQGKSGTRLRLDEILRSKGIDPRSIRGYQNEEFTHSGVVLAVAAGVADVAFALRAATEGRIVDFISIGRETYCLCGKADLGADERYQNLVNIVYDQIDLHSGYSIPPIPPQSIRRSKANPLASIARWDETLS